MNKNKQKNENFEKALAAIGKFIFQGMSHGLKKIDYKSRDFKLILSFNLYLAINFALWTTSYSNVAIFATWVLVYWIGLNGVSLIVLGMKSYIKLQKAQNNFDYARLKNAFDIPAKVERVDTLDDVRTKLSVFGKGIALNKFDDARATLESSFHQRIDEIKYSRNRRLVELIMCSRDLPTMVPYSEVVSKLKKETSFMVGESLSHGFITQTLLDLPHLLIAGTTGGGKSLFFKNILLGLLKSTPKVQMYLIDLKRGIEIKEFNDLPNVKVAKDEYEAVKVLKSVVNEMGRRWDYLEGTNRKKIDPSKDKRDLIVVAIDEASVLYGKTSSETKKDQVAQARELTDELAKLGRAAGIHLVLATQKPIKDAIDTKVLENLPGRISFKMSTHSGSNSILGNNKAYKLEAIKGRAIWNNGHKFIEVQTPYVTQKELEKEIESLVNEYEVGDRVNYGKLLNFVEEGAKAKKKFKEKLVIRGADVTV